MSRYCANHFSSQPIRCTSILSQEIHAPLSLVWSILRRFEKPQAYKRFIKSCSIISGDGEVGSIREVHLVSGLSAETSIERLDSIDDNFHILNFSIIGGNHCLSNYHSTMTLERKIGEPDKTVVRESYIVDVPVNNTEEDTRYFINNIIKWNLESLGSMSERIWRCEEGSTVSKL